MFWVYRKRKEILRYSWDKRKKGEGERERGKEKEERGRKKEREGSDSQRMKKYGEERERQV